MIWTMEELRDDNVPKTFLEDKWVPARSLNYKYRSFWDKIKECYLLWTGKTESFRWPGGH